MTKVILLERLRDFTREATKQIIMPVARQEEDKEPPLPRAAGVYLMRLPDSSLYQKRAPYILHQIITGKDGQDPGQQPYASATVRSIFCVYHDDEQEGGLLLLNLMERLRIALGEQAVVGKQFRLDKKAGLETLVYPDTIAPYYGGELISTWILPPVERKLNLWQNETQTPFQNSIRML